MADIELGWRPRKITPVMSYGQDWIIVLTPKAGSVSPVYPPGTLVNAMIYADSKLATIKGPPLDTWPGSIDGDNVVLHTEAARLPYGPNEIVKGNYMRIMIDYPGTPVRDPFCWAKGVCIRDD